MIFGIDFLRQCGAIVDCCAGEVFVDGHVSSGFLEETCSEGELCASTDSVVPASTAVCVPVVCRSEVPDSSGGSVAPLHLNCGKKNVFVPYCVALICNGRAGL